MVCDPLCPARTRLQGDSIGDCGRDVDSVRMLVRFRVPGHHEAEEAARAEELVIGAIKEGVGSEDAISKVRTWLGLSV